MITAVISSAAPQGPLLDLAEDWIADNLPDHVLSDCLAGWGQAVALAALKYGIPVTAYISHVGQGDHQSRRDHELYGKILMRCVDRKIVGPNRDEAMIDAADMVLTLGECIYAEFDAMKPVTNLRPQYEDMLAFT